MKILLIFIPILLSAVAHAQPVNDRPFGFRLGMTLDEVKRFSTVVQLRDYYYKVSSPLIPNANFTSYAVTITPKAGLCSISAVGNIIISNNFGDKIKMKFIELDNILTQKYGFRESFNYVDNESTLGEDKYFSIGLFKKERHVTSHWLRDFDSTLPENIEEIELAIAGNSLSTASITLQYFFKNMSHCASEISNKNSQGL